tara:strand:+ start:1007 stop:1549 length:543 start_codon:yes stop_codon:yes gene_type:complete
MKKITLLIAIACFTLGTHAQKYKFKSSTVKFESEAPKENIEATNKKAKGIIDFTGNKFSIKVPITGFIFNNQLMQEHFNEKYLESESIPYATYKGSISGDYDLTKDGMYRVVTKGTISIHGVEKDIEIPSTIKVKGGNIFFSSTFNVEPKGFEIKISSGKSDNIANSIKVLITVALVKVG